MALTKQSPSKLFNIGAEVMTPRGIGCICFVYPKGPHQKVVYSVSFKGCRIKRLYDEGQLKLLGNVRGAQGVVRKKH